MKNVFYLVLASVFMLSCNTSTTVDQKKESEALMEVNREWSKAASISPEAFFSFIGSDALMMAPDKFVIRGHEGIGKLLQEFQSYPGFAISWEPQEAHVSKSGDLGYTLDRILVTFNGEDGNKVKLFEKGITIWNKQEDGSWKLAVDIWNVDTTISSIYK